MTEGSFEIRISAAVTARRMLFVALALTAAHVMAMLVWYQDLLPIDDWLYISFFDLDEEESLGTWYSSLILLFAGLLSLLQARLSAAKKRSWVFCWYALGYGFMLLSLDEVAGFHEFVNTVVEDTHWTTFGLVLVGIVGLFFLPFLAALPPGTRWLFLLAGLIFVGGAVGVERATISYETNDQLDTLGYNLTTALEEFMEMSGVILYIYALLARIVQERAGQPLTLKLN